MRAFIALELPAVFKEDLASMVRALMTAVSGHFMMQDSYHLMLAFLGEVGEVEARDAIRALDAACADTAPVLLRPEKLGKFGRASDATLWLSIAPVPELMLLADRVRESLANADIAFDEKPFRPHITLARRARLPKGDLPALPFPAPAYANTVTLFKSTLTHDGARYKPLYSVVLTA